MICATQGHGQLIKLYNRDMLVLDDSEWGAYLFTLPSGATAIVQQYGAGDESINSLVERVTRRHPSESFPMHVQDTSLRLLVGAEEGSGSDYGYKDVPVTPGKKRCDVFSSRDELVVVITAL